ncbi:DNA mismatch repair protein mlh3 [Phtheirospermum japonicum]|uniref:DNA mismatch repair protein mlh3 n=1 Tax=Phtheirospermum japonicum TaxID=374723 RepID=A0A830D5K7_9LAMI|nr:DNA mismatch repair protein mlh3 [Phtheirospermum japonicum]
MGFCNNSLIGRNYTMRSIERLPEAIHNSVRSGALICDLTRIVEELVFNSLDAGSTKVSVAVWVGNYYVKVDDNGCGITRDGLVLLGERYTTSKIDHIALMDTGTENLDFRGEALSSISDVSLLEIVTKTRGKPNGYRKLMKNSKCLFLGINDDRQDVGTTVIVRDIFYNQPVRRKHMESSPKKVLDSIKMSVLRIALVHVNVSFKVVDVESADELFLTGPLSSPLTLLSSYFGIENSAIFYKLNLSDGELKLSGYISDPRETFSSKSIQYVYINSRFVYKGPIHKLLNQLAAKFDLLNSWQPATSFQSEKRNKYDICPAFILNLHCPRSYYGIITSERTSVEFKDWGHVLTFIENEVMRFWTENISPVPDTLLVTSDKDMPDTFGSGKKRCRKQNLQAPLYLDSPRQKKLCKDYDNTSDFEGRVSSYRKLCRKVPELNKHHKEASILSEMDYPSRLCGGSVKSSRVTVNKEIRNDPSPCRVYSRPHVAQTFGKVEDDISSTLENTLSAFDAKINNISIASGVAADSLKFNDVHLDQEPSRFFLRSCSSGRNLLHERNSLAIDERFQLGSDDIGIEKTWIDCDDSMGDKINLAMCGRFPYCEEPILLQSSPITQYDMHEILEFPMWDSVKSSLVFGNTLLESSNLSRKWTTSRQCFSSGWSPLTAEKNIGIKYLDDDDSSYGNLIEGCYKFGKDTIHGYYAQGEGEDFKLSNLNSKYGWLQQKGSFVNISPDSKSESGEFRGGDDDNMFSPKSYKIFRETDWSLLPSYGEESPRNYPLPSLHDTSPTSIECEIRNIRNQKTTLDNKKMFIRSHSAPPFHKRKKRFMDLTNSSTMLSTKSNYWNISATRPSTEPSDSSCGEHHSETRNLKCSQTSFYQYQPSPMKRTVIDCFIAERPVLKITPEVTAIENGGPQKMGQCVNMESVKCLDSMEIRDPLDSRWKWRKCFLPSAGGSRSDNKKDHDIIIDISSDILNLAGDPLVPNFIDRTSLEDAEVLNQVDKKFIAVVAGKTLAIIDQHAADERIRLEDLRLKVNFHLIEELKIFALCDLVCLIHPVYQVLSGEMKTVTYLDGEQEMVLPEIGYQLLQNFAARIQFWGWICNIHSRDTSSFAINLDFLHRQQTVVKLLALADTDGSSTIPPSVHRVLNNKACRGTVYRAIMFGDTLLPSECSLIVEELKRTSLCFQCAHGRPTTIPIVNLDLLHNRIAKIGSPQSWHGLRRHKLIEYANGAMSLCNMLPAHVKTTFELELHLSSCLKCHHKTEEVSARCLGKPNNSSSRYGGMPQMFVSTTWFALRSSYCDVHAMDIVTIFALCVRRLTSRISNFP